MSVYVGVDVGSTAVRVGILNDDGELVKSLSRPIRHIINATDHRFITQSSEEIWEAFIWCMAKLDIESRNIKGVGVAATCSVVVLKRTDTGTLDPYSADYGFQDENQNVIFWMDTRAEKETREMNKVLLGDKTLEYMGGSFVEEMGLPKVKAIMDNVPPEDRDSLFFFDLNDYLSYRLSLYTCKSLSLSDAKYPVAIDGEVKGWTADLLGKVGLPELTKNSFSHIGRTEVETCYLLPQIPYAGSKIGIGEQGETIAQGVIDSYGGWLGSCGKQVEGTLTMVAGTSTCFIFAHKNPNAVKGIWGPFSGFFQDLLVSEGGQATTGKLLEHLFETHPAYKSLEGLGPDIFASLEILIKDLETRMDTNIHHLAKHMFMLGELSGNRSPYADASMRGVFFGESTDISIKDLVLKYVCILECLAFQAKHVLSLLNDYNIKKVLICGSQAKNSRFVSLLSRVTGLPVELSKVDPELSGVRGAAYLGYAAHHGLELLSVLQKFNQDGVIVQPESANPTLTDLLQAKYEIMLDVADSQLRYKRKIDSILEN